uniref:EF-hand domain-containing protein n=1 Tax=Hanusia phi TaxID=3032 RepID=A0A7S0DXY6_9CRYP|mmetsp:Transcript_12688/g.29222  ORF Transcript_12688/g.29222 Transcript_12688/m.29222 type:complete len:1125 (+) Transcript_12688:46-3420(+)
MRASVLVVFILILIGWDDKTTTAFLVGKNQLLSNSANRAGFLQRSWTCSLGDALQRQKLYVDKKLKHERAKMEKPGAPSVIRTSLIDLGYQDRKVRDRDASSRTAGGSNEEWREEMQEVRSKLEAFKTACLSSSTSQQDLFSLFRSFLKACSEMSKRDCDESWRLALKALNLFKESQRSDVVSHNMMLHFAAQTAANGCRSAFEHAINLMTGMVEENIEPDLVSFNSMMNVCAKSASMLSEEEAFANAFSVLDMMRDARVAADTITFTSMMELCARSTGARGGRGGSSRGWQKGMEIHAMMREQGLQPSIMTYIQMVKICLFSAKLKRAGKWTEEAVRNGCRVLELVREDGLVLTEDFYNHFFSLCAKAAEAGYEAAVTVAEGLYGERNATLPWSTTTWNSLLNVYAKSGKLAAALSLMRGDMKRQGVSPDLVTWNTLMSAMAKEALAGKSSGMQGGLEILEDMRRAGVKPDVVTYNALMRACTAPVLSRSSDSVFDQGSIVLDMMRADGLVPDVVTYTTILNACIKSWSSEEEDALSKALHVVESMQAVGLTPNLVTCNCLLTACSKAAQLRGLAVVDMGIELIEAMERRGVTPNTMSFNALIAACSKAVASPVAGERPTDCIAKGLQLIQTMRRKGLKPNVISYTSLVAAGANSVKVGDLSLLKHGSVILELMEKDGIQADAVTFNSILDMYSMAAAAGLDGDWVRLSWRVLELMRRSNVEPDGVSCAIFIDVIFKSLTSMQGDGRGRRLRRKMQSIFRSLDEDGDGEITVNELKSALLSRSPARHTRPSRGSPSPRSSWQSSSPSEISEKDLVRFFRWADTDANGRLDYEEFEQMLVGSANPRNFGILPQSGTPEALKEARHFVSTGIRVLEDMLTSRVPLNVVTCNALLDSIALAAELGPAQDGGAFRLCWQDAHRVLELMRGHGIVPNSRSFSALLKICVTAAGSADGEEALRRIGGVMEEMRRGGVEPDTVAYNILLDGVARAPAAAGGGMVEAIEILNKMIATNVRPDGVTFLAVIKAARQEGTSEAVALASSLFAKIPADCCSIKTYSVMMKAMLQVGRREEVLDLLEQAATSGMRPDKYMMAIATQAASSSSRLKARLRAFRTWLRKERKGEIRI